MRHAICIVVDRLSAGFLGAYGNTWIDTSNFDQLASEANVFDQMIVDSPRLSSLYDAYWTGSHAVRPCSSGSLPDILKAANVASVLLTDDAAVAEQDLSARFDDRSLVELPIARQVAEDVEKTHFADFFAAAASQLGELSKPTMIWLHTCGLAKTWDAPVTSRTRYAAEEDPDAYDSAEVPCLRLEAEYDPDELLRYVHAYAGQVTSWDECLGGFLQAIEDQGLAEDTLLIVMGARGFPLGEHRHVGGYRVEGQGEPLYGELVHVPCVMRIKGDSAARRSLAFVQPPDVFSVLVNWFNDSGSAGGLHLPQEVAVARSRPGELRNRAAIVGEGEEWAIRTSNWFLRSTLAESPELYVKADDRWEVNDVADRCPDVVNKLCSAYKATCEGDSSSPLDF